ncbi:glycosyltransferase [Paenibacillus sp. HN-1]|nr:glycosyltransferase [Paenibacillus sp. CGMCC 1.18879]MBY9078661.1 glycosyltransferase [Paenibacillus sp. CGMCC 1.18879]MBY9084197.1 glycosyltransferase [Paenibacillus sinensis]
MIPLPPMHVQYAQLLQITEMYDQKCADYPVELSNLRTGGGNLLCKEEIWMPNLSVLMPVYNASRFLGLAVESVLQQSYSDFELIIINDGSTDDSLKILEQYPDSRIRLMDNGTNRGIVYSLNQGLNLASGRYIARMDADDCSLPDRFKMQIAYMDLNPDIGVLGTQYRIMNALSNEAFTALPCEPDILECSLLFHCCLVHPAVMMRRRVLDQLTGPPYDPAYQYAEDYNLWARLSSITRIANLRQYGLYYRLHDQQLSRTQSMEQQKQADRVRMDLLKNMGLTPSPTEWELHRHLCFGTTRCQPERDWIMKILARNLTVRRYDQAALMDVLNRVLER